MRGNGDIEEEWRGKGNREKELSETHIRHKIKVTEARFSGEKLLHLRVCGRYVCQENQ